MRRGGVDGDHDIDLFHRAGDIGKRCQARPEIVQQVLEISGRYFLGARPGLQTENGDMQNFGKGGNSDNRNEEVRVNLSPLSQNAPQNLRSARPSHFAVEDHLQLAVGGLLVFSGTVLFLQHCISVFDERLSHSFRGSRIERIARLRFSLAIENNEHNVVDL